MPGALPTALRILAERLGSRALDRLWIFPPRVRGRREWGLVAASCFHPDVPDRRLLYTARYGAERTRHGPVVETDLSEQGEAPPDRLPRVMEGVAQRSPEESEDPREVWVGGESGRLLDLIEELESS